MSLMKVCTLQNLSKSFHSLSLARNISTTNAIKVSVSPVLSAMPTKKKRKIDPAAMKLREEKRKRRIMKVLKKMEKKDRIPKPISELEPPLTLIKQKAQRTRNVKLNSVSLE